MSAWERAKENRDDSRRAKRSSRKHKISLSWTDIPVNTLGLFCQAITGDGRAVLLGASTDGSVLSVNVYEDGEKERYYVRGSRDVIRELADIIEEYSERAAEDFVESATPPKEVVEGKATLVEEKPAKKD